MPGTSKAASSGSSSTLRRSSSKASSQSSYNEASKLRELFIEELKDIYWAEKHLTKALPRMAKAATSQELRTAFENHTVQTQEQIARIEQVFEILQMTARAKKCEAMAGLVLESQAAIEDTDKGTATRDCALIISAQKAEHYEIATYGSLVQLSKTIGHDDIAQILQLTLNEEKETDVLLTELAVSSVNLNSENETE
ncbi:MAG TPA: ferritin-like domain-containing protein [Chitinophagaceae bacterium]|nr:ferritin-like domain-containing protein [Chitinophagaceae bacterium]